MYIGRTAAYYGCDDDYVFTPDLWDIEDDAEKLAGEVTQDEEQILNAQEEDLSQGPSTNKGNANALSSEVFGRNIFNNPNLTFAPNMNIATPQNYVLGPGDVLVVDIYGGSQENLKLTVSPEGDVYVPEFGPIQVSGLQIGAAQPLMIQKRLYFQQISEYKMLDI